MSLRRVRDAGKLGSRVSTLELRRSGDLVLGKRDFRPGTKPIANALSALCDLNSAADFTVTPSLQSSHASPPRPTRLANNTPHEAPTASHHHQLLPNPQAGVPSRLAPSPRVVQGINSHPSSPGHRCSQLSRCRMSGWIAPTRNGGCLRRSTLCDHRV